jgi:hypothetical protein
MASEKSGKSPKLSREEIRRRIDALPPRDGADCGPVTQRAALAAFFDLESRGSTIPDHIKLHEDSVYDEIITKLEAIPGHNSYVITPELLRGIIRRVGHTTSAQAMLEVGGGLLHKQHKHKLMEITALKRLFAGANDARTEEAEPTVADSAS